MNDDPNNEIHCVYKRHSLLFILQVDPSTKEVVYQFKISNVSNDKIFANAVCLLHPHPVFEISDEEGLSRGKAMLRMFPGIYLSYYYIYLIFF